MLVKDGIGWFDSSQGRQAPYRCKADMKVQVLRGAPSAGSSAVRAGASKALCEGSNPSRRSRLQSEGKCVHSWMALCLSLVKGVVADHVLRRFKSDQRL